MSALLGLGVAAGVIAAVTAGAFASRRRAAAPFESKPMTLPPALVTRVNGAYGEWVFRLQEKCPWCADGKFRALDRTMKLNVADGSLEKRVVTQCSRCRWKVDAAPDPMSPALLACAQDVVAGPAMSWSVLTASGSPIAEVTVGGGKEVQVTPAPEAQQSNDARILLATLLFRGACSVSLPGMDADASRIARGAAVQSRIVRAQIAGMPRVARPPESIPPPA
jgi:hypothetical protein